MEKADGQEAPADADKEARPAPVEDSAKTSGQVSPNGGAKPGLQRGEHPMEAKAVGLLERPLEASSPVRGRGRPALQGWVRGL